MEMLIIGSLLQATSLHRLYGHHVKQSMHKPSCFWRLLMACQVYSSKKNNVTTEPDTTSAPMYKSERIASAISHGVSGVLEKERT